MEPNQRTNNRTDVVANAQDDIAFTNKPRAGKGMIMALVCAVVLAVGGIGFGVWAMIDGNQKVAQKDEKIRKLDEELEKQGVSINMEEENIEINGRKNPVIESSDPKESYSIFFDSSIMNTNSNNEDHILSIVLNEGKTQRCELGVRRSETFGDHSFYSTQKINDCVISGLDGEIYKIVEFGAGQDNSGSQIGFIMTDGRVKYFSLYNAVENNDYSIRGDVKIDGRVTDVAEIRVSPTEAPVGGYGSSVFVLDDGSFVKFDESMLKQD